VKESFHDTWSFRSRQRYQISKKKLASKSSLNNDIQLGFKAPPVTLNMLNQTNMTGGGNLVA